MRKMLRNKKGQGLVEYGLIIAGVALIAAASVSIFGHKTTDLIAAVATVLPGAHDDDNAPIVSGKLIETTPRTDGALILDAETIATTASGQPRLADNVLGVASGLTDNNSFGGLILEAN